MKTVYYPVVPLLALALLGVLAWPASLEAKEYPTSSVHKVVIDPGHGGSNLGALGVTGVYEKDINLAVAKYLRGLLVKKSGVEVLLTREDDRDLPLAERLALANSSGADLFISIHCNASFNADAQGAETYVLSPEAALEESERVARKQIHRQGRLASCDDEGTAAVVKDLWQSSAHLRSYDLAAIMQGLLVKRCNMKNRGVKELAIVVLRGAEMPAVVVELGFLSHPKEGRMLADPQYQKDLASALYWSILEHDHRLNGSGAPGGVAQGRK